MDELVELLWDRGTVAVRGQSSHPSNNHNLIHNNTSTNTSTNTNTNTNTNYNYKKTTGAIPFLFAPFDETIALSPTPETNEKKTRKMMNKDTGTLPKFLRFGSPEPMLAPDIFSSVATPPNHHRDRDHVGERDEDADTGTVPWIDYPVLDASERYSEDELPSNLNHNHNLPLPAHAPPSKPLDIQAAVPVHKTGREDDVPCANKKPPQLQVQKGGLGLGVINFSNFLRPVVLAKASLQSSERLRSNEKASTSYNNNSLLDSMLIQTASALQPPAQPSSLLQPQMPLPAGDCHKVVDASNRYCDGDNKVPPPSSQQVQRNQLLERDNEKGKEKEKEKPVLAPTSVCSRNVDSKHKSKRKFPEEDFATHSDENFEDESVGLTRPCTLKGGGIKRGRTAEVHNLSERRRRDRINEKMRALQELIPNCNKVDKASMLDEAIEHLKSLQLQVQMMMMMGAGMCIPPMMLPPGLHHMPLAPYPHMGMGMGMNMGMGINMGMGYGMGMGDIIQPAVNHTIPTPPPPPPPPHPAIPFNFMPMINGSTFKLGTGIPSAPSFASRDICSDSDDKTNGCHMPSQFEAAAQGSA